MSRRANSVGDESNLGEVFQARVELGAEPRRDQTGSFARPSFGALASLTPARASVFLPSGRWEVLVHHPFRTSVCPSYTPGRRPGLEVWLGAKLGSGDVAWESGKRVVLTRANIHSYIH